MSKLLTALALLTAGFGFSVNSALAQDVRSMQAEANTRYQEAKNDCSLLQGAGRSDCLQQARERELGFKLRCDSRMGDQKIDCLQIAQAAEYPGPQGLSYKWEELRGD